MPRVTALYAALLALLFLGLSLRVIGQRHRAQVALGTGGDPGLQRAVRVHANFAEYAPLVLTLLLIAELLATPGWWLHVMGIALLAGRGLHAFGVSREPEDIRIRGAGMALTFTALGSAALTLGWRALAG